MGRCPGNEYAPVRVKPPCQLHCTIAFLILKCFLEVGIWLWDTLNLRWAVAQFWTSRQTCPNGNSAKQQTRLGKILPGGLLRATRIDAGGIRYKEVKYVNLHHPYGRFHLHKVKQGGKGPITLFVLSDLALEKPFDILTNRHFYFSQVQ